MTVCVVAKAGLNIFAAADRMITADDVQFEPATSKVVELTRSVAVLTAGDASLNAEIITGMRASFAEYMTHSSETWLPLELATDYYVNAFAAIKSKRAEAALLRPLALTLETFLARQGELQVEFVRSLVYDLQHYAMPLVEAIVTGIDSTGAHIFTIRQGEARCDDSIGFSAIGNGARHAESQFMVWPQGWSANEGQVALMTYLAKRRAEIAPGVGLETDMYTIGPAPGTLNTVLDVAKERLRAIYRTVLKDEARAAAKSTSLMAQFHKELTDAAAAKAQEAASAQDTTHAEA
jgi:hypothetical protein